MLMTVVYNVCTYQVLGLNIVKVSDHVGSSQVQLQVLMENTVFSFTLFLTNHADKK